MEDTKIPKLNFQTGKIWLRNTFFLFYKLFYNFLGLEYEDFVDLKGDVFKII